VSAKSYAGVDVVPSPKSKRYETMSAHPRFAVATAWTSPFASVYVFTPSAVVGAVGTTRVAHPVPLPAAARAGPGVPDIRALRGRRG
jgi:hypothetical protein